MTETSSDAHELAGFGYLQRLARKLGGFSTFAVAFSYLSVLEGTFILFNFGYGQAGPAFIWAWPIVFVGMFCIALCFAELAARYPIAGSVFSWSRRITGGATAWLAGWVMLVASIVTVASVAVAWQVVLPVISASFQFVGGPNGYAENTVLLGAVMLAIATVLNCLRVSSMARFNNAGVLVEIGGVTLLILLFLAHVHRGPAISVQTFGTGHAYALGYLGAFLVGALASAYNMYGFDTASTLAEETRDPRRYGPRAILQSISAAAIGAS